MGIEDLTQLEIIDGIFGLIYPAITFIVGGTIMSKYFQYKRKELLFIGLTLAVLGMTYLSLGLTFITVVFFDYVLDDTTFFIIHFGFSSLTIIGWMYAMCILLAVRRTKTIVSIYAVITILHEIFVWWAIFTDLSLLGTRISKMDVDRSPISSLWTLFTLINALVTMLLFIRDCFRSDNPRILWKGRFLLVGVILLVIGGIMIALNISDLNFIIISRIIIIARQPFSYIGWLMPERIAKWLIKESES